MYLAIYPSIYLSLRLINLCISLPPLRAEWRLPTAPSAALCHPSPCLLDSAARHIPCSWANSGRIPWRGGRRAWACCARLNHAHTYTEAGIHIYTYTDTHSIQMHTRTDRKSWRQAHAYARTKTSKQTKKKNTPKHTDPRHTKQHTQKHAKQNHR